MRRALTAAVIGVFLALVPPSMGRADAVACQRSCQRNYDDCRDDCPRSSKVQACLSKCQTRYRACIAACH